MEGSVVSLEKPFANCLIVTKCPMSFLPHRLGQVAKAVSAPRHGDEYELRLVYATVLGDMSGRERARLA
jgi:hypothetical protein